jgi:hypothetical protein
MPAERAALRQQPTDNDIADRALRILRWDDLVPDDRIAVEAFRIAAR